MAVTHHGYNILKMPGSGGIITVPCEERDVVCSLERTFQVASIEDPDSKGENPPEAVPKKKKTSPSSRPQEVGILGGAASGLALAQGAPPSLCWQCMRPSRREPLSPARGGRAFICDGRRRALHGRGS